MKRIHKLVLGTLVVLAAAAGGALAPNLFGAGAATGSTTTTAAAPSKTSNEDPNHEAGESAAREAAENNGTAFFGGHDRHGTAAHESAEKPVTGDAGAKAKAAALKAVGDGTAGDVTTDLTGSGYEVTITKADGSTVEVHLDSSFAVRQGGPHGDAHPSG